jgi:predicted PurR-regulated permease PerM
MAMLGPSIRQQSRELTRELPKALQQVERWIQRSPARNLIAPGAPQPQAPQQQQPQQQQQPPQKKQQQDQGQQGGLSARIGKEMQGAPSFLFPVMSSVVGSIGGLIIVLFIAMYIAADPGLYREGMLHLVPHRNRAKAREWLAALRDTLRQWLVARLMAMVIIGVLTGAGLALLKVKGAAALGVLAGLLEFVPFFGPIASAVPAIGIALVDSPQKALWVAGLYLLMQQLEGNVVTPLLLEKRLAIPPVMTVVAVAAMGMVFGVLGMLVAEPLIAAVLVTTKMLYVNDVVGDDVKIGKEK